MPIFVQFYFPLVAKKFSYFFIVSYFSSHYDNIYFNTCLFNIFLVPGKSTYVNERYLWKSFSRKKRQNRATLKRSRFKNRHKEKRKPSICAREKIELIYGGGVPEEEWSWRCENHEGRNRKWSSSLYTTLTSMGEVSDKDRLSFINVRTTQFTRQFF